MTVPYIMEVGRALDLLEEGRFEEGTRVLHEEVKQHLRKVCWCEKWSPGHRGSDCPKRDDANPYPTKVSNET